MIVDAHDIKYQKNVIDGKELHIFQNSFIDFYAVICLVPQGRGPALGGCRFSEYPRFECVQEEAYRLAIAMNNKALNSGLPHDGGKAVLMKPRSSFDRGILLKAFAQCVQALNGKYITTIDSGTTPQDMSFLKIFTPFCIGGLESEARYGSTTVATAKGMYCGLQAAVKQVFAQDNLNNLHVAIQGVGGVGYQLAKILFNKGAKLTICDIDEKAISQCVREFGANVVDPEDIYGVNCDIFSPCALGQIITQETAPLLKSKLIAGAANDQLQSQTLTQVLQERGIMYIPDFLINAGGFINLALQLQGQTRANIEKEIMKIYDRVWNFVCMRTHIPQ